uniref:Uncharacterized protein n=1 Tax=Vespula pensylvanica TaxID=30213 RepID=A0A834UCV3_VESPE|nr:hypothetical protein H0235_004598 [Vespula pensylvanica]
MKKKNQEVEKEVGEEQADWKRSHRVLSIEDPRPEIYILVSTKIDPGNRSLAGLFHYERRSTSRKITRVRTLQRLSVYSRKIVLACTKKREEAVVGATVVSGYYCESKSRISQSSRRVGLMNLPARDPVDNHPCSSSLSRVFHRSLCTNKLQFRPAMLFPAFENYFPVTVVNRKLQKLLISEICI